MGDRRIFEGLVADADFAAALAVLRETDEDVSLWDLDKNLFDLSASFVAGKDESQLELAAELIARGADPYAPGTTATSGADPSITALDKAVQSLTEPLVELFVDMAGPPANTSNLLSYIDGRIDTLRQQARSARYTAFGRRAFAQTADMLGRIKVQLSPMVKATRLSSAQIRAALRLTGPDHMAAARLLMEGKRK